MYFGNVCVELCEILDRCFLFHDLRLKVLLDFDLAILPQKKLGWG